MGGTPLAPHHGGWCGSGAIGYGPRMRQPELPGLADSPGGGGPGLLPLGPSGRLRALLAEHEKLLKAVARKRERVRRLGEELQTQGGRVASVVEPLRDRLVALDAEVHALFGELLAGRRLSRQAKRDVTALYRLLQREEVLSPAPRRGEDASPEPAPGASAEADDEASNTPPRDRRPGRGLRELFLGLANALHPDKAQNAHDVEARGEAMKEVNRAYQDGDLARLLELERAWSTSRAAPSTLDDLERRCAALEQTNRALRAQLAQLTGEEREMASSELGRLVREGKRRGRRSDLLAEIDQDGKRQIERLTEVRDHVRAFRDGKISLEDLLGGPAGPDDADEELALFQALADLAAEMAEARPPPSGRGKRRARRRG
jgi:hypothetical protein